MRGRAFLGFSRIAVVLIGVLMLAGTYLAIVRLPDVSDLWTTSYGRVLLLKIGIVCVALAWGAAHHFLVRPRLERGEAPGGAVGRSLLGESAVAMTVLLVAAVLVNGSPPPVEPAPVEAAQRAPHRRLARTQLPLALTWPGRRAPHVDMSGVRPSDMSRGRVWSTVRTECSAPVRALKTSPPLQRHSEALVAEAGLTGFSNTYRQTASK